MKEMSKNQGRMNTDIKRELIDILAAMKDPRINSGMLTITRVETAQDLSTCKVYVSVLGDEDNATANVVAALDAAKGHVRSEIASKMNIRRAPEFIFIEDKGAAHAARINEVLKDINEPKE